MKLPFLSNQTDSWPWPSCTQTRTLSFRTPNDIFKAVIMDTTPPTTTNVEEPLECSIFTNSSETTSFSTAASSSEEQSGEAADPVEAVIKGSLRSERLFFKPELETSSILEEAKPANVLENRVVPFKESVALSMESRNPYLDFKKSMEEMVEAAEIKDWEGLEELLFWYLKMNGNDNHGYIVGAFVDLLVGLAFNHNNKNISNNNKNKNNNNNNIKSCSCSSCVCESPCSPLSFCNTSSSTSSSFSCSSSTTTTPCVSSIGVGEEDQIETPCLSSLLESTEEEEEEEDGDVVSS